MAQALFVWLGAKRAEKRGVGERGILLDRAARAGLPVPRGGILLDEFYRSARQDGLFVEEDGRLLCPNPAHLHEALYEAVRFPRLEKPVAVRPIFSPTDGRFASQFNIHFTDPPQLADSLRAVYATALGQPPSMRRDVLVIEMVAVVVGGTAVTDTNLDSDTIVFNAQNLTIPQLGRFQAATPDLPDFVQRLQKLLRGLRRTFGTGKWRVSWADDGVICWLLELTES
jgi:hypothetical protein